MALNKLVEAYALLAGVEASYNQGPASTTGSGAWIDCRTDPQFAIEYLSKGDRKSPGGSLGMLRLNIKSGRSCKAKIELEARGISGSALTTSSLVEAHPLLVSVGLSQSFANSSHSYQPNPINTVPLSAWCQAYSREELTSVSGTVGTFTFKADAGKPGSFTFDVQGTTNILPVDVTTIPVPVYTAGFTLPPLLEGANLIIGPLSGSNLVASSIEYDHGQKETARMSANAPVAHLGFVLGNREPKLKIKFEAPFATVLDVHNVFDNSSVLPISFVLQGPIGNSIGFTFANAQISTLSPQANGRAAEWEAEFIPTFTPNGNGADDVLITFY